MPYKDPEKAKQKRKEYYAKNRERLIQQAKAYNKAHPEWYAIHKRHAERKIRYGITKEQYEALLVCQNNLCAICKEPSDKSLCVDHDHKTGKIRGLLCFDCNRALGCIGDSSESAFRMFEYLKEHE